MIRTPHNNNDHAQLLMIEIAGGLKGTHINDKIEVLKKLAQYIDNNITNLILEQEAA